MPEHDVPPALGQTNDCHFVLLHCGQAMRWAQTHSTWQGKWPEGTSTVESSYLCDRCGAKLETKIVEPDRPPSAP